MHSIAFQHQFAYLLPISVLGDTTVLHVGLTVLTSIEGAFGCGGQRHAEKISSIEVVQQRGGLSRKPWSHRQGNKGIASETI